MKQKRALLLFVVTLCILLAGQSWALATELSIEEQAELIVSTYGASSLQYALMVEGEIVLSGVAGQDKEAGQAPTAESMYGIGSTSKVYTTAIIMKLVDEGKIDLDAPVTRYIPEFKMADARYTQITVRMLLNHSSGLMGTHYVGSFLWDDNSTAAHDELLANLATSRLKADPGAFSVYCNDGFTLAEIVAERVSGQSFTALIADYISGPLGLSQTKTPLDDFDRAQLAGTYHLFDAEWLLGTEYVMIFGTGGIYSSAEDLASFGQIFTGEADLLSEAARTATFAPEYQSGQHLVPEQGAFMAYGLGWDSMDLYPFSQYDILAVTKGGDTMFYHASLVVLPELQMSAAVLSSGGSSAYNEVLAINLLLQQLEADGTIEALPQTPAGGLAAAVALPEDFAAQYEGLYINATTPYWIQFTGNQMLLASAYFPEEPEMLPHVGEGRFRDSSGLLEYYFLEQEGNLYLIQDGYMELPGLGSLYDLSYLAQKAEPNPLEEEDAAAWEARNGKFYVLVNDIPSSQIYTLGLPTLSIYFTEQTAGYLAGNQLIGQDLAQGVVEIPVANGRDLSDYRFYSDDNGVEYATDGDYIFMGMEGLAPLYGGARAVTTIQEQGYARWYVIGEELEGKTLRVECPEAANLILYSPDGLMIYHSSLSAEDSVTLPANGLAVFLGAAGAQFTVTIE